MKIKLLTAVAAFALLALGAALAMPQTPNAVTGNVKHAIVPPTARHAPEITPETPAPAPQLTEIEQLKLENLSLKAKFSQEQLNQQYTQLIQQIQAEHPGYIWNPATGLLQPEPKPAPAAPTPPTPAVAPAKAK